MAAPYCKKSYIGAPVKAVVHACEYCTCGKHGGPGCKCRPAGGICAAVVDDANNRVYLYGNVVHENYHVPGNECIAHVAVESAGFSATAMQEDEFFDGVQDSNNVILSQTPIKDNTFFVFLNGVKQREGAEYDYVFTSQNTIHFNFHDLVETDSVEVLYTHRGDA